MLEKAIKINGNELQRMISESVNEAVKEWRTTRNPDATNPAYNDGKYTYQGTGSEESSKRVKKLRDKRFVSGNGLEGKDYYGHPGRDNQQKNDSSAPYNPSRSDRADREYGDFETDIDSNDYLNPATVFLKDLREFAIGKIDSDELVDDVKRYIKSKEDAQRFLKYLYQNGFKSK